MGCSNGKEKQQQGGKKELNAQKVKAQKVKSDDDSDDDSDYDDLVSNITPIEQKIGFKAHARGSVSAEAYGKFNVKTEFVPPVIEKDAATKKRIRAAINKSLIFKGVDKKDQEVVRLDFHVY